MPKTHYAAIDIGSNAVRLLIKRIDPEAPGRPELKKVLLLRVPLRLGFDIFRDGALSPRRAEKLRRLMKAYRQMMKIYDVADYRACATSAMRDAANGPEVIRRIRKDCGLNIEIIDGREEAQIVYGNHLECTADRQGDFLYVDVGGGSTEVNFLSGGELQSSVSYDIGTVRLLTGKVRPSEWKRLDEGMAEIMSRVPRANLIGSGGNINKLYRMSAVKDRELQRLPVPALAALRDELAPLTPDERARRYALKDDRADVIVPAADIVLRIARAVKADFVHVPVIGLADGLIDQLWANRESRTPQRPD